MLLYFILGILFYAIVIPLIESLVVLIATFIEVIKGKLTVKITQSNVKIQQLTDGYENSPKNAIGFTVDSKKYYENEDDNE